MNYYLLIPFFIILLLFIPVRLEGRISFNLLEKTGAFGIFVFGFKATSQQFWIENKKLITRKENSVESHELNTMSKEYIFFKNLTTEIRDKTRLKQFFIFYNLGIKDAFRTAMLCGALNSVLLSFMTAVKNEKPTASVGVYDSISYNRTVCQFATKALMTISLFDVVYSLVRSVILTKKMSAQISNGGEK